MSRVLITGGAGFIGSNLVDYLVQNNQDVIVLDNLYTGKLEYINPKAKFYLADIRGQIVDKIFSIEKPDVVVHLAAQMSVPYSVANPKFDLDVNLNGLLNLLESSVKHGVTKFVFSSSGGTVYGDVQYPVAEDCILKPFPPYAISKTCSEHYLNFYKSQYGLNNVILRFANVYGPRQLSAHESGVVTIFAQKILKKEPACIYTFSNQTGGMKRDYIYIDDVVKALVNAIDFNGSDVFNIGTGIPTKTLDLLNILCDITGYKIDYTFGSPRDGDLEETYLIIEKAKKILNWTPQVTLPAGLQKTLDYFKSISDKL